MIKKLIIKVTFLSSLCASSVLLEPTIISEEIDQFVHRLPPEQRASLEAFAEDLLTNPLGSVGYVLYGDKPMCLAEGNSHIFGSINRCFDTNTTDLHGFSFLKALNIDPRDKKFAFIEDRKRGGSVFFNRDAFIQVVNQNLILFRSILGSTLTAEGLLEELLRNGDRFYETLQYNELLLGVLLGYGTQNALVVSREEQLKGGIYKGIECFPFKDDEVFATFNKIPSIGFSSVEEEYQTLYHLTQLSTDLKPFTYCHIPHFGCQPELRETTDLLTTYEKNRASLIQIVEEGDLLTKLLKRLSTTISGKITLPPGITKNIPPFSWEDPQTQQKIIHCALSKLLEICEESPLKKEVALACILKGAKWREAEKPCKVRDYRDWAYRFTHRYIFPWCEKTKQWKAHLKKMKKLKEQAPGSIYYKILIPGEGPTVTTQLKKVSFHFSTYSEDGQLIHAGTIKNVAPHQLTSGVAFALLGMKRGEERRLYMHPKYIDTWQIDLKLLDFEEGEKGAIFPQAPEGLIKEEEMETFLKEYRRFKKDSFIQLGYETWSKMKENGIQIGYDRFSELLKAPSLPQLFEHEQEKKEFILNYNCAQLRG